MRCIQFLYFGLSLHASDFMLPTSYTPHAWGLKAAAAALAVVGAIHPTRVGSERREAREPRRTHRSTPHAWGLKHKLYERTDHELFTQTLFSIFMLSSDDEVVKSFRSFWDTVMKLHK